MDVDAIIVESILQQNTILRILIITLNKHGSPEAHIIIQNPYDRDFKKPYDGNIIREVYPKAIR